ncbi:MAG: hypothetical protein ACEY3K_08480 [Wolbachia sp.]
MGGWNLSAGLMSPAVDTAEKEKERRHSRDSGNESQEEVSVDNSDTEDTPSNGANTLKFQLTQSLIC